MFRLLLFLSLFSLLEMAERLWPRDSAAPRRRVRWPIHHSILRAEHDRNFGFHVSWWDRLFGSYPVAHDPICPR